ncbi:MAG: amidohydrolase [Actinomycetota bacterium]|nr:amidohydrolase [Actinomycetota bacterium]
MSVDRIYLNGTIKTMAGGAGPSPTALWCRDGTFGAVGSAAQVHEQAGRGAEVIDLAGATVVPGFIETHLHPLMWGLQLSNVDAHAQQCPTIEALVEALAARAVSTPIGEPIHASGFDDSLVADDRGLTIADLDRVSTQHPVEVRHLSEHAVYVNSVVLARFGIDAQTPNPVGGEIVRDANGAPTGELRETPAMSLVYDQSRPFATDGARPALTEALQRMAQVGVTSFHDMYVTAEMLTSYRELRDADQLPLRARLYLGIDVLDQVAREPEREDDWYRIGGVKLIADGSIQLHTAALSAPYHDLGGCSCGAMVIPTENLVEMVARVHAVGRQVAIHTNGDEAIEQALNAIAQAQADRPNAGLHHRLEHVQTIREDQLARMAAMDVGASIFVNHVYYWGDRHRDRFLGPDRAARISPVASALAAGLRYALHCDCPVTPVNPLFTIATAVNRRTRGGAVLGPEQGVSPADALAGYTSAAARVTSEETVKGSIEVGKLADFVVLGGDPFTCAPEEIAELPVQATVVGGNEVYRR